MLRCSFCFLLLPAITIGNFGYFVKTALADLDHDHELASNNNDDKNVIDDPRFQRQIESMVQVAIEKMLKSSENPISKLLETSLDSKIGSRVKKGLQKMSQRISKIELAGRSNDELLAQDFHTRYAAVGDSLRAALNKISEIKISLENDAIGKFNEMSEKMYKKIAQLERTIEANAKVAAQELKTSSAAAGDSLKATSNNIAQVEKSLEYKIEKVSETSEKTIKQLVSQTGTVVNSSISELRKTVEMIICKLSPVDFHRQLGKAAADGNVTGVRQLLDIGCLDVNWRDENEYTPCQLKVKNGTALHRATQCNRATTADIVKMLIEIGANVNLKEGGYGTVSLHAAAYYGNLKLVGLLLEKGAGIDSKDNNKWTALIWAARYGQAGVAGLLLAKGAEIDSKDNNSWTALMLAAYYGQAGVAGLLLDKGAEINLKDDDSWTALMMASRYGHAEVVELLLAKGAEINLKTNDGWTALMMAAIDGHLKIAKQLLDKRAEINSKKNDGGTALIVAALNNKADVAQLLLQNGADRTGYEAYRIKHCPSCPS